MKRAIYLCARYSRHPEMQEVAASLRAYGYEVTSRWINGTHDLSEHLDAADAGLRLAQEDWDDLMAADTLIAFSEHPKPGGRNRGGRHVEFGIAMAKGYDIMVVGPKENVFHYLPLVSGHFASADEAIAGLQTLDSMLAVERREHPDGYMEIA